MGKRVQDAANLVAGRAKETADAVTANVGGPLGGSSNDGSSSPQKRSYHSSAVRRAPENPEGSKPVEEQSAQHPGQSGHDHLENPSMSEEDVHADRTGADPLPGDKKPSRQDQKDQSNKASLFFPLRSRHEFILLESYSRLKWPRACSDDLAARPRPSEGSSGMQA